jgi:hypothetical protein
VRICLGALALLALSGLACGGGDEPPVARDTSAASQPLPPDARRSASAALRGMQRAFAASEYARLCAGMTRAAARQAGEAGHGTPTKCPRDVRRLLTMLREGGGLREASPPRTIGVERDGSGVTATVARDRPWKARVPLTREGGDWLLSGFFGATNDKAEEIARAGGDTDFPPPGREPLEVANTAGDPCPGLSEGGYPRVSGGCRVRLSSRVMPLRIRTLFGSFGFDECSIHYRVRIDSSGRTWTDDFKVGAGPQSKACGDIDACYAVSFFETAPWRGRVYPGEGETFIHRSDICLRTCVGVFVGELAVRLTRVGDGWRAEPVDGGGDSGLSFDSPLEVEGDVDIDDVGL